MRPLHREPELFRLELSVLKQVRSRFANLHLMLPFVRTGSEFEACMALIGEAGLKPGRDFEVWIMAEVPSVAYLAGELCPARRNRGIKRTHRAGIPCSICGQAPSVYPEFVVWLVERGIGHTGCRRARAQEHRGCGAATPARTRAQRAPRGRA